MGLAASRQARFCVRGRPAGGERPSRTVEPEARHPAAATLPTRGPHSPRVPRRCRPWSKKEAAWKEEDGGGQERWQRWGCFPERYARVCPRGGEIRRHPGVPHPRAAIVSPVLWVGLGPRGPGRSMAHRERAASAPTSGPSGPRLGQAGARRRGGSAASRGPGRPARGAPKAWARSHLHVFDGSVVGEEQSASGSFLSVRGKFQTTKLGWNWPSHGGRGRGGW